jgi:hypothetical protein
VAIYGVSSVRFGKHRRRVGLVFGSRLEAHRARKEKFCCVQKICERHLKCGEQVDEVGEFQGLRGRLFQKQAAIVWYLDRNGRSPCQTRPPYPNSLVRHAKDERGTLPQ